MTFRLRRMGIDTQSEHVIFIREEAVREGILGFKPLDRVLVSGQDAETAKRREVSGVLNFCEGPMLEPDEIGLSNVAFADLGLPAGASIQADLAASPNSVDHVRHKLRGGRLDRSDFDAILEDVVARRYSKPELSMFVLACALQNLDDQEIADFTMSMVESGSSLQFDAKIVADKHCIGGVPGNRTTMVLVPILVSLGLTVPKTSSKAITSAAGTADTMAVLARVDLSSRTLHRVVDQVGGCIAWGGALDLAPADDVLITVERPMQLDTEAQMVASILAKKKTAGATHALIDIPLGPSTKIRTAHEAELLTGLFNRVAEVVGVNVDVITTDAHGPIGRGIGPRLEALDVLAVLRGEAEAPEDLREKSLFLASRILERTGTVPDASGYRIAQEEIDSGRAALALEAIIEAQGAVDLPAAAAFRATVESKRDGRIQSVDCLGVNRIAKLAGSPAHPAAGMKCMCRVGDVVRRTQPLFEIHAQSRSQLDRALEYATSALSKIVIYGY
jgi:thymidine phosphorylase